MCLAIGSLRSDELGAFRMLFCADLRPKQVSQAKGYKL